MPVAVLLTVAGLHVPAIPLLEVAGKTGAVPASQIIAGIVKVGVTLGVTVTDNVVATAQRPAVGVNA